jgi:hypothetical protein
MRFRTILAATAAPAALAAVLLGTAGQASATVVNPASDTWSQNGGPETVEAGHILMLP